MTMTNICVVTDSIFHRRSIVQKVFKNTVSSTFSHSMLERYKQTDYRIHTRNLCFFVPRILHSSCPVSRHCHTILTHFLCRDAFCAFRFLCVSRHAFSSA